jgi:hypothetical protein
MDTDQHQILLALRVDGLGSGVRGILGLKYAGSNDYELLSYDHVNNRLQYKVNTTTISVAVPENQWFLANLVWDSSSGISLTAYMPTSPSPTSSYLTATASGTGTALGGADLERYRWGGSEAAPPGVGGSQFFQGYVGDVYFYNTATDNLSALVDQLAGDYGIIVPEPSTILLLLCGAGWAYARRRL